ncbi:MAG: glutamate racemase [Desulfosarcinaceae bacterium]|nr:glutamate racemase [Desulfosarcinaceae bacterium]
MIGIFDSGIGGLTVARAILEQLPDYDLVYFGDTARTPYGNKSALTVQHYARRCADFLISKGAQVIIIACNTAASAATDLLSNAYPTPIFEVITPGAAQAARLSRTGRIGVIGTRSTIASGAYERRILAFRPNAEVISQPCPLLVPLVEEGWIRRRETAMIVKKYLRPLKQRQIDTIILGCTHYPVLADLIQAKAGAHIRLVDSAMTVANQLKTHLAHTPELETTLSRDGRSSFFISDVTPQFQAIACKVLNRRLTVLPAEP